ncbi:MAG: hypothetical protein R3223_00130 [Longimicrobiales bacterium]|nr:hypothetical protein [Longimicrobiales bacterium]
MRHGQIQTPDTDLRGLPGVDGVRAASGVGPSRRTDRTGRAELGAFIGAASLAVLLQACASTETVTRPLADPAPELEATFLEATRPTRPAILIFDWRLNERGSRVEGQGVARLEPPDRVRLDLFTENGETAARAALVRGDLRVPPDVDRRLVPPPPLLWASLGIFHPGDGFELLGGERLVTSGEEDDRQGRDEERIRLRYRAPSGEEARFVFESSRLLTAELLEGGTVVERVELEGSAVGSSGGDPPYPSAAAYRDRSAFRELRVVLEEIREPTDPFSSDIWFPQW